MLLCTKISFVWEMFAVLFAFALVTAHVATELPSYIHPCGRKDPNYDQCITDNINSMIDKICTGIPEFNISPVEPIFTDKVVIFDTDNMKLYLKDTKTNGICDLVVNSVHTDRDRLHFDFDVLIKHLDTDAMYDFDVRILVPVAHMGLVHISLDNVRVKVNMDLKVATKNGEKHIYAWKVNSNVNITSFEHKFDDSEKYLVQLHKILNDVVANSKGVIINNIKPVIEEEISKIIISVFNNITRSNYEKLFHE